VEHQGIALCQLQLRLRLSVPVNPLPTDGTCRAVVAWQIDEGYYLFITPFGGSLNSSAANLTAVATLKADGGFN
jgi:hypothetical protein